MSDSQLRGRLANRRGRVPVCFLALVLAAGGLVACGGVLTPSETLPAVTLVPAPALDAQRTPSPIQPTPGEEAASLPPAAPLSLTRQWQVALNGMIWSTTLSDLTGGGYPDILAAANDRSLHALDSEGATYWEYASATAPVSLTSGSLDGQAARDVIAGGDDGMVRVLSPNGGLLWEASAGARTSALLASDFDGDGLDEVLAGSWAGSLVMFDASGVERWRGATVDGGHATAMALGDLDADGSPEIVLATARGAVEALNANGTRLWAVEAGTYLSQVVPVDLDGGGRSEVVAATRDGELLAFDADGGLRWSLSTGTRLTGLLVANLDDEPGLEVLAGGGPAPGRVLLTDEEGRVRWSVETQDGVRSLAAGDLDRDGYAEIVVGGQAGQITLLDRFGQTRGTYATPASVTALFVSNLMADGPPDVLAQSGDTLALYRAASRGDDGNPPSAGRDTLPAPPGDMLHPPTGDAVEVIIGGDVSLSPATIQSGDAYGPVYPFEGTAQLLRRADVTAVNLNGVLTADGRAVDKPDPYRASPDFAQGLQLAGVDVAFLANQHALDYGQEALDETVAVLRQHGVHPVGVGADRDAAYTPTIVQAKGLRIAFLAFADDLPQGWDARPTASGIAPATTGRLERAVRDARQQADAVVVGFHMGRPGDTSFNVRQQSLAQSAIDAGADLVVGYGTGTVQEALIVRDGVVAYSLGDFTGGAPGGQGALLRVLLTGDGLQTVDLIPLSATPDGQARLVAQDSGDDPLPIVQRLYPRGVTFQSPRINADPGPATDYTLDVTLNYDEKRLDMIETVTARNDTADTWTEMVFTFPANFIENVVELDGVWVTHNSSQRPVEVELEEEQTILRVSLPEAVPPGAFVTTELRYALFPPETYPTDWQPYSSFSYDDKLLQAGEWYAVLVPYGEGAGWLTWDYQPVGDPIIYPVADYDMTIRTPPGVFVASGGETSRPANVNDGGIWRFHLDNARGLGFLASPNYRCVGRDVEGISLRSCYQPEHEQSGLAVLDMTERAVTLYNELFGPYTHDDLVVAENGYYGAMEYSATLSITEPAYAFYNGFPDTLLEALVAHEVAHMWWYEVVGNDQVDEPWLDESLASYSELLYYERYYPDLTAWWWNYRVLQYEPTGPVDVTIYDYTQTEPFVRNMYGQASLLIQDLRHTMGDPAFFAFLQDYYRTYAGQIVTTDDFFNLARRHTDANLSPLLNGYFRDPNH